VYDLFLFVHGVFESLTGAEANCLRGGDLDSFARRRIAPLTRRTLRERKTPETRNLHCFALRDRPGNDLYKRVQCPPSLRCRQPGFFCQGLDEFALVHVFTPFGYGARPNRRVASIAKS